MTEYCNCSACASGEAKYPRIGLSVRDTTHGEQFVAVDVLRGEHTEYMVFLTAGQAFRLAVELAEGMAQCIKNVSDDTMEAIRKEILEEIVRKELG